MQDTQTEIQKEKDFRRLLEQLSESNEELSKTIEELAEIINGKEKTKLTQ